MSALCLTTTLAVGVTAQEATAAEFNPEARKAASPDAETDDEDNASDDA